MRRSTDKEKRKRQKKTETTEKKKDKNIAYSSKYFFSSIFAIKTIKIFNY